MPVLSTTGSEVPWDFPAMAFDRVCARVANIPHTDYEWAHFGGAWNAIAYRFLGAAEADDALTASFTTHGSAPPPPHRTRQELDLFTFVSCACSSLDSFSYALFALGAFVDPRQFPMATPAELRRIGVTSTMRQLRRAFPGDELPAAFRRVTREPEFRELSDWRNIAIHRAAAGRQIHLSAGTPVTPPTPDAWKLGVHRLGGDIPLGPSLSRDKRRWLADQLARLIDETDTFLTRRGIG
jgi:hypothetical protein